MPFSKRDIELGMDRPITRRDFLNGVALTIGGAAAAHYGLGTGPAQPSPRPTRPRSPVSAATPKPR